MIWKVIATVCSSTFFISGFSVLGDPSCLSADIGGGRVIGITCYQNSYGAFTPGAAASLMILIGIGLLILAFWQDLSKLVFSGNSFSKPNLGIKSDDPMEYVKWINGKNTNQNTGSNNPKSLGSAEVSVKTCDKCNENVPMAKSWCGNCSGTSFSHKKISVSTNLMGQTSEEAMSELFNLKPGASQNSINPEHKTCPMCAEEIKFAAKKCRYCQHMMEI